MGITRRQTPARAAPVSPYARTGHLSPGRVHNTAAHHTSRRPRAFDGSPRGAEARRRIHGAQPMPGAGVPLNRSFAAEVSAAGFVFESPGSAWCQEEAASGRTPAIQGLSASQLAGRTDVGRSESRAAVNRRFGGERRPGLNSSWCSVRRRSPCRPCRSRRPPCPAVDQVSHSGTGGRSATGSVDCRRPKFAARPLGTCSAATSARVSARDPPVPDRDVRPCHLIHHSSSALNRAGAQRHQSMPKTCFSGTHPEVELKESRPRNQRSELKRRSRQPPEHPLQPLTLVVSGWS